MRRKIILTIAFVATAAVAYLGGVINTVESMLDSYIDTTTEDFYNIYIDMRKVKGFVVNGGNLQLYLEDGSGYYWER